MSENANQNKNFSVYYLNLSQVYEIAMSLNNTIVSTIERSHNYQSEKEHKLSYGLGADKSFGFLSGLKSSISNERKTATSTSSGVVEKMEVMTTKSVLLRNVIRRSKVVSSLKDASEGDLIKLDNIKLELVDEESVNRIILLRRNALKGLSVSGMEISNFLDSILQDYAYILRGRLSSGEEFIIKIPTEINPEFENKYSINDLMIGHVSVIGIFKGDVAEESIRVNMLNSLQSSDNFGGKSYEDSRIINSDTQEYPTSIKDDTGIVSYVDCLAIVQDITFPNAPSCEKKLCWWNRFGLWLSTLGRGEK